MKKTIKDGYLIDFISGQEIKSTTEEVDAVQIFSKQLVEDYGYPKNNIQTRPQFRVKKITSNIKKEYYADIAVFPNNKRQEDEVYIIVECKKKNRKDGLAQLKDYLRFSKAYLGVWFNGNERFFLRKVEKNGKIKFEEIPNIPKYGQRLEDIGRFKRKDLKATHNLKSTFKAIRNHLVANTVGATRDEVLAQQLINLIFCKIYDEKFTKPDEIVTFRVGIEEKSEIVKKRILDLFSKVKRKYKEVFDEKDLINLDAKSIAYVVGELQNYCLIEAERDIIADAFETFIGHALKGGQGQFFTPRNVVKMMVDILDPDDEDFIIDPACGSGGFLIESLRYIWKKLDIKAEKYHWNKNNLQEEKIKVALNKIRGIDKDYFLSKVARAYITIIGDGKSGIFNEDSLEIPKNWGDITKSKIYFNYFSILLANPPFGSKIPVRGEEKLKQFELGYKWKLNKKTTEWEKGEVKEKEDPQTLFIERSIQLLKDGGKMAIVLPEGIFGNPSDRYIWEIIRKYGNIVGIISLPQEAFQPNTHMKTSILIFEKSKIQQEKIFMAIAGKVGHDKNGKIIYKINNDGSFILDENNNRIIDDDMPEITKNYKLFMKNKLNRQSHLGFYIESSQIKNNIYIPSYYDPDIYIELENLKKEGYTLIELGNLIKEKIISIKRGNEIGSQFYSMGKVPFVRTSDIVNWEIKIDPVKGIPDEIYQLYKDKQDIKEGDLLFVKDGTFLIGRTAFITSLDEKIVIQSHILKIRINKNTEYINPYYLIYLLNLPIVKKQIKNKTFIQGTISTIGDRIKEIILPIKKDEIKKITEIIKSIIHKKEELRKSIIALIKDNNF
jgi:type I restriction enzyme M protein